MICFRRGQAKHEIKRERERQRDRERERESIFVPIIARLIIKRLNNYNMLEWNILCIFLYLC